MNARGAKKRITITMSGPSDWGYEMMQVFADVVQGLSEDDHDCYFVVRNLVND